MSSVGPPSRAPDAPARFPLPPGPRGHWLLGTSRQWRGDTLALMAGMVREHGDAVRYHFFGGRHGHLFVHPDHLRRILQDNYKNYLKTHPTYRVMRPLVGLGILTSDGSSWLAHRRLMAPAFHRDRIAALGTMMTDATETMLARWDRGDDGRVIAVDKELTQLTLEVVGQALFGHDLRTAAHEVLSAFTAVSHQVAAFTVHPLALLLLRVPVHPATRRLRSHVARLDAVVHRIIAGRQESGVSGDDLLGMLVDARDEETGAEMTAQELRDEVMTLMVAGHETTAQALSWTFYLLSQHPEVEARVRRELGQVLGGRTPTAGDLERLGYLCMTVQEAMRIYPPVYAFPRVARAADVVGGYRVEAGALIMLSPYLTHRHREFWPDPERFDPDRFAPEHAAARPTYAYIPFAGGPRRCIGNAFALTEIQLVLATVLQRYRLALAPGHPVQPSPMIALRPRYGLPMMATRVGPATRAATRV